MKKLNLFLVVVFILLLCGCSHTHDYAQEEIKPTCTEDGYTKFTCECGDTYHDNTVEAGHMDEEVLSAKAATCTEDGLTEGKKCSACGEILVAQQTVAAKGHQYGEWVVVKEATFTENGTREKECSACGDKQTEDIPVKEDPGPFNVVYDLNGGNLGGYTSIEQLADAFLVDFNTYGSTSATKENFQVDSTTSVKVALSNAEMLKKWNWLWVYMLELLQVFNEGKTSAYITDIYPVLEKMIKGDTTAIEDSANARTSIRSYIHGILNSMKGCGEHNDTFAAFSPDFSIVEEQQMLLEQQYDLKVTLDKGAALLEPTRDGYQFKGWQNENGDTVTEASCNGTLTAIWEKVSK